MIATTVAIMDIRDAEGFVAAAIQRSGVRLAPSEREELIAEGLAILCDLANRYEPQRPGYAQQGRFSGYAAMMLPKRLQDAWYRLHPEHQVRRDEQGRRVREYGPPAMSLHHEDMPDLEATAMIHPFAEDESPTDRAIRRFIEHVPAEYRMGGLAYKIAEGAVEGRGPDEMARQLGLNRSAVAAIRGACASAMAIVEPDTGGRRVPERALLDDAEVHIYRGTRSAERFGPGLRRPPS